MPVAIASNRPLEQHLKAVDRAVSRGIVTQDQARSLAAALTTNSAGTPILAPKACPVSLMRRVCDAMDAENTRWTAIKRRLVEVATDEFENTWNRGTRTENQPSMTPIVERYWRDGVYEGGAIPSDVDIPAESWSAAFIAWVVQESGGGDRFSKVDAEARYRAQFRPRAHWRYVAPAKLNREKGSANPFWAFGIDEMRPEAGDIIVRSRANSNATFDNFEFRQTHGDIVVDVRATEITVIGGNAGTGSNTVARREYPLDAAGFVASSGGTRNDHFAIVRINTDIFQLLMCDLLERDATS